MDEKADLEPKTNEVITISSDDDNPPMRNDVTVFDVDSTSDSSSYSSDGEPAEKSPRYDSEIDTPPPSPSSEFDELRQGQFQRAFIAARNAEVRAEETEKSRKELEEELELRNSRIEELSKQLKEANRKAERYMDKNIRLTHENIYLKNELKDLENYVLESQRRRCELVGESVKYCPDAQIRSVNALARRNPVERVSDKQLKNRKRKVTRRSRASRGYGRGNNENVEEARNLTNDLPDGDTTTLLQLGRDELLRDRKRKVKRRGRAIAAEEERNLGNDLPDWDATNLFQLCRPSTYDSISVTSALTQLSAKFTRTRQENWRKYCRDDSYEMLRCEICDTVVKKVDVFEHFFTQRHIDLVRSHHSGVSLHAVQHWLRELVQAFAAAAAKKAMAANRAAAAAAAEQQKLWMGMLQQAIISK